jgi:hypothetical protein
MEQDSARIYWENFMKSFKMNALALAVFGLCGLAFAGSAFALCPDPTANGNTGYTTASGGAWHGGETVSSATIASTTGLNGTTCGMKVALTATPASNGKALVTDDSPNNEQRYRVRFYVDLSHLTTTNTGGSIRLLNANSVSGPPGASTSVVTVLLGGTKTAPFFRFLVADPGQASLFKAITVNAPTPTGVNRVEFDYNTGTGSLCAPGNAHGSFCVWVTDGAAATGADSTPVGAPAYPLLANAFGTGAPANNWTGVKLTNFGIFTSNANYRTGAGAAPSQSIVLDEFDSRRSTMIGK